LYNLLEGFYNIFENKFENNDFNKYTSLQYNFVFIFSVVPRENELDPTSNEDNFNGNMLPIFFFVTYLFKMYNIALHTY